VELAPPRRIVEAVSFVTTDRAFFGEMTMIATFEEVSGGTEVTLVFKNLAAGLAGGGQRGWLTPQSGAAGPPLRMRGWGIRSVPTQATRAARAVPTGRGEPTA
jgi:hypothetical protein